MKKILFFTTALFLNCFISQAQIITTIAGYYTPEPDTVLGDGGPAIDASLYGPYGVALDGKGNLYITDGYHDRIRKVNSAGIITTIAGTGVQGYNGDGIPATAAQIYRPVGIICDHYGNIYFADAFNNRVRKIDTAGIITTVAGNGGNVYNGDNIAATAAAIYDPHAVALDAYGNMYITDYVGHRIRKVNTIGIISTIAGTGVAGYTGDNGPATAAEINTPYGIVLDDTGNVYYADDLGNVVRKIDTLGIITTFAGTGYAYGPLGDGGPADSASLNGPASIAIDENNNIYISEINHMRVRIVAAATGIITTVAGDGAEGYSGDGGPATAAELNTPTGLCIDPSGGFYIADFGNYLIRRVGWPEAITNINDPLASLTAYPNPNSGAFSINISTPSKEEATIVITNVLGETVQKLVASTNQDTPVLLDVPAGIYIVSAVTTSGKLNAKINVIK